MRQKLIDFFDSPTRNQWLYSEQIQVYLRKGRHLGFDGKIHHYLDIASIEVEADFRRQGLFKAFLALSQEIQPYDGIKIENVLNDDLKTYLRKLASDDLRWSERGDSLSPDFLWEK